MDQCTFVYRY